MNRAALSLPLLLAACAVEPVASPSLGIRPIEKLGFEEPEPRPVAAAESDPALDARLRELGQALDGARSAFDEAADQAEAAARHARGAAAGSDPWLDAQVALGRLDVLRAGTSERFTDVEDVSVARAAELKPDYPALAALLARARAELDRQDATIRRLTAALAPA